MQNIKVGDRVTWMRTRSSGDMNRMSFSTREGTVSVLYEKTARVKDHTSKKYTVVALDRLKPAGKGTHVTDLMYALAGQPPQGS
jgi:hypothetical protein